MKKIATLVAIALCAVAGASVVQYSPTPGAEFASTEGGALKNVTVFSATAGGSVSLERVLAVNAYTNAVAINTSTSTTFTVVWTNITHHVVTTNVYDTTAVTPPVWCRVLSSNIVTTVTATTNTWPVLKETVTTNETICTGSLTGNLFTNSPAGFYLLPGERLIFSGSAATNGWLRLTLE